MTYRVLFHEHSKELVSTPFMVYPGSSVIIRAWNIAQFKVPTSASQPTNLPQEVKIQMVEFGDVETVVNEEQACDCEAKYEVAAKIKYAEDIVTCCPWSLTACDNITTISLPGVYRLRLDDPSSLGEVYATMFRGPTNQMGIGDIL